MYDILGVEPKWALDLNWNLWIHYFCYWVAPWRWHKRLLFVDISGELIEISTDVLIYTYLPHETQNVLRYMNLIYCLFPERAFLVYRVY